MPYRLLIEVRDNTRMEQFQREFDDFLDAKRYAHNHVRGDIHWTVREDHMDGLAPDYAFRIEMCGDGYGKPLNIAPDAARLNDSLFAARRPVEEGQ